MSEPPETPIPVIDFLRQQVGPYKFSSDRKEVKRSNFVRTLDSGIMIEAGNGKHVAIPAGTTLVVYRSPDGILDPRLSVACFHYPGGGKQTIVYGSGRAKTQELSHKSLLSGGRRLPRLHLRPFD